MKSSRLLVAFLNLVLVVLMIYAGMRIYTHFLDPEEGGFFEEIDMPILSDDELSDITRNPVKNTGPSFEEYEKILTALAIKPPQPVEELTETEGPEIPELNISVLAVNYDTSNSENNGAHIEANRIPRFLLVGDRQKISDNLPYHLVAIDEEIPDKEYVLIFEDENGNKKQRTYRKNK